MRKRRLKPPETKQAEPEKAEAWARCPAPHPFFTARACNQFLSIAIDPKHHALVLANGVAPEDRPGFFLAIRCKRCKTDYHCIFVK